MIREGDALEAGDVVRVSRSGTVVVAAPECQAFAVTLGKGTHRLGGYAPEGRGPQFVGPGLRGVGDERAGGIAVPGRLDVRPLSLRCGQCVPHPSMYEVRSLGRFRARVRVSEGSVLAAAPGGTPVRVFASEQADSRCVRGRCRLTKRLYHPDEPWKTSVTPSLRLVRLVSTALGARPERARLAPPFAVSSVDALRAAGGEPEELLVRWTRTLRSSRVRDRSDSGILVWQRDDRRARTVWRVAYERRFPPSVPIDAQLGDLTGEGQPDALVQQLAGSGGCGPKVVLATVGGRVRELFRRNECETMLRLERGSLIVDDPIGPCWMPGGGGAHCSGGTRHTIMRWDGRRLAVSRSTVKCYGRLDPRRNCTR